MSPRIQRAAPGARGPRDAPRGASARLRSARERQAQYIGPSGGNIARPFALIAGLGYLAVGVIGFVVTGFSGLVITHGHPLLGLDLNVFHNLFHLVVGGGFVVASRLPDVTITQGVLIGGGAVYLVAALLGFLDTGVPIIAIHDNLAPDNFFHLFSGATAVVFGLLGASQQSRAERAPV